MVAPQHAGRELDLEALRRALVVCVRAAGISTDVLPRTWGAAAYLASASSAPHLARAACSSLAVEQTVLLSGATLVVVPSILVAHWRAQLQVRAPCMGYGKAWVLQPQRCSALPAVIAVSAE